jgi:site-specific recombinase XerD
MVNFPNAWAGASAEKIKYLTDDQVARFFKAIEAVPDKVIRARDLCLFNLMLSYGLRVMEVALIKRSTCTWG